MSGNLKWSFVAIGKIFSSAAIGSDGTIYVGSADSYLYAISTTGNITQKIWLVLTIFFIFRKFEMALFDR